jgi:hypothetical protein
LVAEVCADVLPDAWKLWLQWKQARARVEGENPSLTSDIRILEADQGQFMGFIRMVARRK